MKFRGSLRVMDESADATEKAPEEPAASKGDTAGSEVKDTDAEKDHPSAKESVKEGGEPEKKAETKRPSFLRRLGKGLLYFVIYAALMLGILEFLVATFIPQVLPRDAPQIYYPAPDLGAKRFANMRTSVNTGERDVEICTNARSDRCSCVEPEPEHCDKHVLILGDSFVEALAIPFEQTVWSRIQKDTGACVDVAGVSAYNPPQYMLVARERIPDPTRRYDLVMTVFYNGNDFVANAEKVREARQLAQHPLRLFPEKFTEQGLHDWAHPLDQWLESRSHLYVATRYSYRKLVDEADVGTTGIPWALRKSTMNETVVSETARDIELIAAEARKVGAKHIVTVIPFRSQITDPEGETIKAAFPTLASDIDTHLVEKLFMPKIRAIEGTQVIDMLPTFMEDGKPDLWGTYDTHPSPRAHEIWFNAIRGPVREALGLP